MVINFLLLLLLDLSIMLLVVRYEINPKLECDADAKGYARFTESSVSLSTFCAIFNT